MTACRPSPIPSQPTRFQLPHAHVSSDPTIGPALPRHSPTKSPLNQLPTQVPEDWDFPLPIPWIGGPLGGPSPTFTPLNAYISVSPCDWPPVADCALEGNVGVKESLEGEPLGSDGKIDLWDEEGENMVRRLVGED